MKTFFSEHFKKQLKKLKKKYPRVKEDLLAVIDIVDPQNEISIGRSIFKVRVASTDMQKGKSGGFRAYLYFYVKKDLIVPLCIYPKSNTESITDNELQYHFNETIREIIGGIATA